MTSRPVAADVLFLCSTQAQALTFAPVAALLTQGGLSSLALTLDAYLGWQAAETCAASGLAVEVLRRRGGPHTGPFYARHPLAIWREVLRARPVIREALERYRPRVLTIGNDRGLLEKAFIRAARRAGVPIVLVQDGRLFPPPARVTLRGRVAGMGRSALSSAMRALGASDLAASMYGQAGADRICAIGPDAVDHFRALGVPGERIVETGQPRYDALARLPHGGHPEGPVVVCLTPFAVSGLGWTAETRQAAMVRELAAALREEGRKLIVRPHPRDPRPTALDHAGAALEVSDSAIDLLLASAAVACIGVSSVIDEAILLGVPVLVPGHFVHGTMFEPLLPPADPFLRFESGQQAAELVVALDGQARRRLAERQRRELASRLRWDPARPASRAVATVIRDVIDERD